MFSTLFGCGRVHHLRASRWACYCVSIVPSRPPGLAGFSVRGGTGRRTGFRFQCPSWRVGSSPTGRTGWPFGGGLAKIEYVNVPVVELVDTPDLGSGVLCGVWVRLPPGALAAEVFGVSSCRSRSPHAIVLVSVVRRVSSIWQNTSLVNWSWGFESPIRL